MKVDKSEFVDMMNIKGVNNASEFFCKYSFFCHDFIAFDEAEKICYNLTNSMNEDIFSRAEDLAIELTTCMTANNAIRIFSERALKILIDTVFTVYPEYENHKDSFDLIKNMLYDKLSQSTKCMII